MPSFSLTADVAQAEAERLTVALVERGAAGVEQRDGTLAPMPGREQPPPGMARLVAWFASRAEAEAAALDLDVAADVAEVADEDWSETWKRGLQPFSVGRVWIRPSWVAASAPPGEVEIVLDPGMAFGTGTHPTTALCLAALGGLLANRPGAQVLDLGTGSGILAIAAAKLGAGRVVGSDDDPDALRVARENAARNGVELELTLSVPSKVRGPFDVVVANILANTLVELAPAVAPLLAPRGVLLLSGILEEQGDQVRAAYLDLGLEPLAGLERTAEGWRLLALGARADGGRDR